MKKILVLVLTIAPCSYGMNTPETELSKPTWAEMTEEYEAEQETLRLKEEAEAATKSSQHSVPENIDHLCKAVTDLCDEQKRTNQLLEQLVAKSSFQLDQIRLLSALNRRMDDQTELLATVHRAKRLNSPGFKPYPTSQFKKADQ